MNFKRVLVLVMAMVMMVSACATPVLAAFNTETHREHIEEVINDPELQAKYEEIKATVEYVAKDIEENHEEYYAEGYAYAYENGYIGKAIEAIKLALEKLPEINLEEVEMTSELREKLQTELDALPGTLEKLLAVLESGEASEFNGFIDAALTFESDLYLHLSNIYAILEQAGIDYGPEALEYIETVVIPAIEEAVEEIVEWVVDHVTEKLTPYYNAVVSALGIAYDTYVKLVETIVKIYAFVENTVEKVVNIYNTIVIKFVEIYGTVDAAIQKAYEIFNKIFDTIIEIKANVEDDIYNIVIAIVKAYQYTIDVLVKVYGTIENAIVVIGQIYDYIVHLVIEYKPFVENAFDILSKVYADIVEIVVNGPEEANAFVEYAAAQIGAYITGILTDFDAFVRAAHYDALNGDYELKDDSYYVALGNSPFGEELAAKLNLLEKYSNIGFGEVWGDYLSAVASADLVTIKVDDDELVTFAEKQVAGTVASIIRNNERLMELYNHDIVGAYVQGVVAEYGIDINAQTEDLDWDKYLDEECQEMLGNALALVKEQLIEKGVPEYYYIDLQPLVERALEENGLAGLPGITITMEPIEVPVADAVVYTIECALFAYARFTNDLNALVESVIDVAPNATVVLLGINNPLEEFDVDFGEYGIDFIDFEDCVTAMDVVVNALNVQLYLKGLTNENVIFVFENDADAIYDALHVYCDHVYDDCLDTNCNRCLEEREAPGHNFTYVSNNDATCTSDGTETAKCDICGAEDTRVEEGSMLDHDMTTKTCTSPARCRVCGYTDGTTLNHTWKSATCTTPRTCEVCKQKQGSALGHSFGKWQTLVEATRRQSGLEKHTCLRCGLVEQRVIPMIPPKYPTSTIVAVIVSALLFSAGLGAFILWRLRKEDLLK